MTSFSNYGRRWEDAIEEYRRKETFARSRPASKVECKGCFLLVNGEHTGSCSCGAYVCLDCCALGDPENAFCCECSDSWAEETEWLEKKEALDAWTLEWKPVMTQLLAVVKPI